VSGLFAFEPAAAAAAPLATGPEAGALEIAGAALDAEAIRVDGFGMRRRRLGQKLEDATRAAFSPEEIATLIPDPVSADEPVSLDLRLGNMTPEVEAFLPQLFGRIKEGNEQGSGQFANLPRSLAELRESVLAEVAGEFDEAERVRARGSGGFLTDTLPGFLGGAVGGLDLPDLPLALLGGPEAALGRRIAIEAVLGAAGEAASLPAQIGTAREMGLEPPSPTLQVAAGAAFAATLPLAGRAVGATGRAAARGVARISDKALLAALRARAGALTPELRGAMDDLTRSEAARAANPGIDPAVFEGWAAQAERALAAEAPEALPVVAPPSEAVRPRVGPPPPRTATAARIIRSESGGRADARPLDPETGAPLSSALGPGQFIESTWLELIGRHRPDLAAGKSRAEILALRTDPALAGEMVERNVDEARAFLGAHDLPLHDGAVFLAHFAGQGGARAILEAAPETPIARLMDAEAIRANAGVKYNGKRFAEFTAQDLRDWSRARMGLATGNIDDYPLAEGVVTFDPLEIRADPATFQFKAGTDAFGVSGRLAGETVFDPDAAIGVMVYERADGSRYIADGHQRLGLAQRLAGQGRTLADGGPIVLEGHLYREADGWTPEMLRLKAAMKNIRAETGTALDAAKIIRDHPELRAGLNASRGFLRQADALGKLTPENFMAVVNGVIPENFGAAVGRAMPGDRQLQEAAIDLLARTRPANLVQAEAMAREVRRLGLERRQAGAQGALFGDAIGAGDTLVLDRARVLDAALRDLKGDAALFERINRQAGRIEEEGNEIVQTANERRAAESRRAVETVLILADEPGRVRDALDAAAGTARSRDLRSAVGEFTQAVRDAIESGDVVRVIGRDDPARVPDPARAGRRAAASDIEAELDLDAAAGTGLTGGAPVAPERFADPVDGPGARDETQVLEAELARALESEGELAQLGFAFDMGDGRALTPGELTRELAEDAEFDAQLDLCQPRTGSAA
jgi:hypothetical protein